MAPHARDYSWFDDRFPDLLHGSLTLVRSRTAEQVIDRVGGRGDRHVAVGIDGVQAASFGSPAEVVGATAIDGWVLLFDPSGMVDPSSAGALVDDTSVACVLIDVNGADRFGWWVDGEQRLEFETSVPDDGLWGTEADHVRPRLEQVGFEVGPDGYVEDGRAAALALVASLTGVSLTAEFLGEAEFDCVARSA